MLDAPNIDVTVTSRKILSVCILVGTPFPPSDEVHCIHHELGVVSVSSLYVSLAGKCNLILNVQLSSEFHVELFTVV